MTNLTPEQQNRMREFVKDLRANPRKAKRKMRGEADARCCLAVALDTAVRLGYTIPKSYQEVDDQLPPDSMNDFYGWECTPVHGVGCRTPILDDTSADMLNDGVDTPELSHAAIADLFEQKYLLKPDDQPNT